MKRFKIRVLLLLPLFLLFFSCTKQETAQYIPSDAALVVSADFKQLGKTLQTDPSLKALLQNNGNPLLKSILNDSEKTGIDCDAKAYLFASLNRDEPTLLLKISDEDQFQNWLKQQKKAGLCGETQKRGDFNWVSFKDYGICAFTNKVAFFVYAPLTPADAVLERVAQLLQQKEDDSFSATPAYTRLGEQKQAVSFYLSLATIPNASEVSLIMGLPFGLSVEDAELFGGVKMEGQCVTLQANCFSENPKLQEFFQKETSEAHLLKKEYFDYIPSSIMICAAMNLDGNGFSKIGHLPAVGNILTQLARFSGLNVECFLDSFTGDFVLGTRFSGQSTSLPPAICYATSTDNGTSEMLKDMAHKKTSLGSLFKEVSPNKYMVKAFSNSKGELGMNGKTFYMSLGGGTLFQPLPNSLSKATYLKGLKGKLVSYFLLNVGGEKATDDFISGLASQDLTNPDVSPSQPKALSDDEVYLPGADASSSSNGVLKTPPKKTVYEQSRSFLQNLRIVEVAIRPKMAIEINLYIK